VTLDFVLPRTPDGHWVEPGPPLATDGSATISGTADRGMGLLPKELTAQFGEFLDKFDRLDSVIVNLAEMTEPRSLADVDAGNKAPNMATAMARFDHAIRNLADDENVANIKQLLEQTNSTAVVFNETLLETRKVLGQLSTAVGKFTADSEVVKEDTRKLLAKLHENAMRLADLLTTFNSLAKGVQEGEGTMGQLLKSDELHRQMVLLMVELQESAKALRRLVVKLEQEGLLRKGG